MSLPRLLSLTRRRWAIPLLGDLHRLDGAKFVTLCNRLGANQGAMRQSLDHLIEQGFVMRNPGHGHPLRPEYILTPAGAKVAPTCVAIDDLAHDLGVRDLCFRRWSLPVLSVVKPNVDLRFSSIAGTLGDITDRALSIALRDLGAAELLAREVVASTPPTTLYRLARHARPLGELAARV